MPGSGGLVELFDPFYLFLTFKVCILRFVLLYR